MRYINKNELLKIILLGLTNLLPKIPLFLAAYILSSDQLLSFNRYFYNATLITIISSFGFDFAYNLSKPSFRLMIFAQLINSIITTVVLTAGSFLSVSFLGVISLFSYSLFINLAHVFQFRLLFIGRYRLYFITHLLNMVAFILLLVGIKSMSREMIYLLFPFSSSIILFINFYFLIRYDNEKLCSEDIIDLYRSGFPAFLINSIVPFLFILDKFLVNNHLDQVTANSYTFAWLLTAPLFYIGNIFEKMIYSSTEKLGKGVFIQSIILNSSAIILYALLISFLLFFQSWLLPKTINLLLVQKIGITMLFGYSIYAVFHFPLNGYLFKYKNKKIQNSIAIKYFILAIASLLFILFSKDYLLSDFQNILLLNFSILALLLLIKIIEIWGLKRILDYLKQSRIKYQ